MRNSARGLAVALSILSGSSLSLGMPPDAPEEADMDIPAASAPPFRPILDAPTRPAVGVEGHAGLAMLFTGGDDRARAVVGGTLRGRFQYFQAGAFFEVTDSGEAEALQEPEEDHWRTIGGFAGVWFPYRRWIDLEATVGVASRAFVNSHPRYGGTGFDLPSAALTWRVGVSDRTTERTFGARIGAALVGGIDLGTHDPTWRRQFARSDGSIGEITGATRVGGVSVALVVAAGLELGGGATRNR